MVSYNAKLFIDQFSKQQFEISSAQIKLSSKAVKSTSLERVAPYPQLPLASVVVEAVGRILGRFLGRIIGIDRSRELARYLAQTPLATQTETI